MTGPLERTCELCGRQFIPKRARDPSRFCSLSCSSRRRGIRRSPTLAERFFAKVNENGPVPKHAPELGPCHVWTGATSGDGYGRISADGRNQNAHRIAWELARGAIPDGWDALHKCDDARCVRPEPV